MASLTFLDPACGSGNFLTETYLSLRRLENEVIRQRIAADQNEVAGQIVFGLDETKYSIKVSIGQFYGIEINDFAVTVAKTALWISEEQMIRETQDILHSKIDFLPLKSYANIICGNALRMDWNEVAGDKGIDYLISNPPFVGTNYLSDDQRKDMDLIWKGKRGKLDYVSCWYVKAAEYLEKDESIKCALVSTNSICQGEQASSLWKRILIEHGCQIGFARRTFVWTSESADKANVHVVIVGFSKEWKKKKVIFEGSSVTYAENINGYLLNAPTVIIEESSKPLFDVPAIVRGSQATDNGFYLFSEEEKNEFLKKEPKAGKYFRQFMMGKEFINNILRYCLWMPDISPSEIRSMPLVMDRILKVQKFREESKNTQTRQAAQIPWRFGQYRPPSKRYIAFAKVSSERRRYIPFGFLTDEVIPGDKLFTVPDATLYHFGVMTSNVHMAWMRSFCGRLKSDYSYSTTIVYNTFPWPDTDEAQKVAIEKNAQAILDARALYPNASLADLYDPLTMPPELRKAHDRNNAAVMKAYGFPTSMSEAECVAALMKMYQELTAKTNG